MCSEGRPTGRTSPHATEHALWGVGWYTAAGTHRERNEDRCRVARGRIAGCVCDGMGGHPGGGLFAECVSWDVVRMLEEGMGPAEALAQAGEHSRALARTFELSEGGAVAACAACDERGAIRIARVGDAHAVIAEPGGPLRNVFEPSPRDFRSGKIAYLGPRQAHPAIDEVEVTISAGSALLIMTDGCALYPPQSTIREAAAYAATCPVFGPRARRAEDAARLIVRDAQLHGSSDDATALVIARVA